jgi:glycosyltransferase involved in cell wall biosynthesis
MNFPKVSIITVVLNNAKEVQVAIESVLSQDYPNIEYIVIDGKSTDGTMSIVNSYESIDFIVSEQDNGLYDAMNKGIKLSTGDIVGILNSDDSYLDKSVISDLVSLMVSSDSDLVFSDLLIVKKGTKKISRYYMAHYFRPWMLKIGYMPPHPTTLLKKDLYDNFGNFSLDYKIVSDFDLFVRLFNFKNIKWNYLNRITVIMQDGGISNSGFIGKISIALEINRCLKNNQVQTLLIFQVFRYIIRLIELIVKPKNREFYE